MFNLVYWSNAAEEFTGQTLLELLPKWREKNARLDVTGLLLYRAGAFIQTLEGEESVVRGLYATIRADPRHYQVSLLQATEISRRRFPQWFMGFRHLRPEDAPVLPGYHPHPERLLPEEDLAWKTSVAAQLLTTFARED